MGQRMWEVAEVFGGVGSLSSASGYGFCFDCRRSEKMNIHTEEGLKLLGRNLVCTKPEGLTMLEPTCSSFLRFVSVHTSKRNQDRICFCFNTAMFSFEVCIPKVVGKIL